MTRAESASTELAASCALQSIASQEDLLYALLSKLELVPDAATHSGFEAPPLDPARVKELAARLAEEVPVPMLAAAEQRTGVSRARLLSQLVEQLRHVAMFATSDGGAVSENVRAVEHLLRSGRVEMFTTA
jgi:hypothetical protein